VSGFWIVDEYSDRVKCRTEKALAKENKYREGWKQPPLVTFETEAAAIEWMTQRAEKRVAKAAKELANEKRRLQKCRLLERFVKGKNEQ
jgi:hypothetical protein